MRYFPLYKTRIVPVSTEVLYGGDVISRLEYHPAPVEDKPTIKIGTDLESHPAPVEESSVRAIVVEYTVHPAPVEENTIIISLEQEMHPTPTESEDHLHIVVDEVQPSGDDDVYLRLEVDGVQPYPVSEETALVACAEETAQDSQTESEDHLHIVVDEVQPSGDDDQALITSVDESQPYPDEEVVVTTKVNIEEVHPIAIVENQATIAFVADNHTTPIDGVNEVCVELRAGSNNASNSGDWTNPQNAEGVNDGVDASMSSNVLSASSGTLTLNYYDWNLSEINNIIRCEITAYWELAMTVSLGTATLDIEYRFGSSDSWKAIVNASLGLVGSQSGPTTIDIGSYVGGNWQKLVDLEVRCVASLPVGLGASASVDAVVLEVDACIGGEAITQQSFVALGSEETWTVPNGVGVIRVDMTGAKAGEGSNGVEGSGTDNGGDGGRVQALLKVSPGETLRLGVGLRGNDNDGATGGSGTFYDGSAGSNSNGGIVGGGGGGGQSYIKQGGTTDNDRVLVAGGGGGGALNNQGNRVDGTKHGGESLDDENITPVASTDGVQGTGLNASGGGGGGWRGGVGGITTGEGSNHPGQGGSNMAHSVQTLQVESTQGYQGDAGYIDFQFIEYDLLSQNFSYTGSEVQWTVPDGVTWIIVDMAGARSGNGGATAVNARNGGRVEGVLEVTPGETLRIGVGGIGASSNGIDQTSAGGWYGGGTSDGLASGGGGGQSYIKQGGTTDNDRVLVGGGGGGGSQNNNNESVNGNDRRGGWTLDDENVTPLFDTDAIGDSGGGGGGGGWRGGQGGQGGSNTKGQGGTNMAHSTKTRGVTSTSNYQSGDGYVNIQYPSIPLESLTFNSTGSEVSWTVPDNVMEIFVDMAGAQGGATSNLTPAPRNSSGGRIQSIISVTPGETIWLGVGQEGGSGNGSTQASGGFYQGGLGNPDGWAGGGGGQSYIKRGGTTDNNRVLVAGGGGGQGNESESSTQTDEARGGHLLHDESDPSRGQQDGTGQSTSGGGGGWYCGDNSGGSTGPSTRSGKGGSNFAHGLHTRAVRSTAGFQTGDGYITIKW